MRGAVYGLLTEIPLPEVEEVYLSPTMDTPKESRFVVLRWLEHNREFGYTGTQDLQVWVHSRDGDYFWIGKTLTEIRERLTNATHVRGSDGVLSQVQWTGYSSDARDDGFRTYTRYSGFRCNGGTSE